MKGSRGAPRCGVVLEDGLEEGPLAALFLLSMSPEPLRQGADRVTVLFGDWGPTAELRQVPRRAVCETGGCAPIVAGRLLVLVQPKGQPLSSPR